MSFATRLQELIGEESISGFARRVEMSEGLIRKYLKGSEPSLSKANQIAMRANCSLEWLATVVVISTVRQKWWTWTLTRWRTGM